MVLDLRSCVELVTLALTWGDMHKQVGREGNFRARLRSLKGRNKGKDKTQTCCNKLTTEEQKSYLAVVVDVHDDAILRQLLLDQDHLLRAL